MRDEVALELAEQATGVTAASSAETTEKEIQTDPIDPAFNIPESVPVAPPLLASPEVSHGTIVTNQQLTASDRNLIGTCLEEIRNLISLLQSNGGSPNVCHQRDARFPASLSCTSSRNRIAIPSEKVAHFSSYTVSVAVQTERVVKIRQLAQTLTNA